jgi:hypothetical protein
MCSRLLRNYFLKQIRKVADEEDNTQNNCTLPDFYRRSGRI